MTRDKQFPSFSPNPLNKCISKTSISGNLILSFHLRDLLPEPYIQVDCQLQHLLKTQECEMSVLWPVIGQLSPMSKNKTKSLLDAIYILFEDVVSTLVYCGLP